jgi:hypothetical protein
VKIVVPFIAAVLIVAALVLCTSVVLGAAAAYGRYRAGRLALCWHRAQAELAAHRRAELLARAEIQHRWWLDGDPRGTYGRFTPSPQILAFLPTTPIHRN